jgi:ABC-type nitrate/sulfonate/bicarbonate transport system substrate-binding protein
MRYAATAGIGLVASLLVACAVTVSPGPPPASAPPAAGQEPAPAAASAPAPVRVRYAYPATSLVFLAQKVALEHGFYRQYGLEVEMVLVGAGVMAAAQLAGEVEYTTSYPATIRTAAQGAPLRIVSTVVGAPLFVLMAQPGVQSLADLRGKPVGITTRGGAIDKVTRDLLAQAGLDTDTDVVILPAGGQVTVLLEALLSGRVQAAALSPPWFVRAREQGMRVLVKATEALREPQNGLAVTAERLAQQREQVRQMVQAEIESIRFIRQNRAATVALTRDWLEISQAEAEEAYDFVLPAFVPDGRIDVEGLRRYVATEKAEGTLPADFQIESILDTQLAEEALRALSAR